MECIIMHIPHYSGMMDFIHIGLIRDILFAGDFIPGFTITGISDNCS
jgi:hypothetical protein